MRGGGGLRRRRRLCVNSAGKFLGKTVTTFRSVYHRRRVHAADQHAKQHLHLASLGNDPTDKTFTGRNKQNHRSDAVSVTGRQPLGHLSVSPWVNSISQLMVRASKVALEEGRKVEAAKKER